MSAKFHAQTTLRETVRNASLQWGEPFRKRLGGIIVDNMFLGLSKGVGKLPVAQPHWHDVERIADIRYAPGEGSDHLLDIYRPRAKTSSLPVVFYIHGGGFRFLSKDTHWVMALAFARRGFLVVNINYRLAPAHPFPAAIEDTCRAYLWALENVHHYGGDASRVIVAGESAGANLSTSLTLTTCFERPEPWAGEVFHAGKVPDSVLPACGIFEVSNIERFREHHRLPWWIYDRLEEVHQSYLAGAQTSNSYGFDLADPLIMLERGDKPARNLPPFFIPVGTKDPLLYDTRRLHSALRAMDVHSEARYYPGGVHAFHAFVWREQARLCWQDKFNFLEETLKTKMPEAMQSPGAFSIDSA